MCGLILYSIASAKDFEEKNKVKPTISDNFRLGILEKPSKNEKVIMSVSHDIELNIVEELAHWYKVEIEGREGFVHKKWVEKVRSHERLEIHAFNVGQGDSYLILCPNGKNVLFDAGSGSKRTDEIYRESLLLATDHYSRRLHYAIVSHPDIDHYGLLPFLSETFLIDKVFYVGEQDDYSRYFWGWLSTVKSYSIKNETDRNLEHLDCGDAKVNFLSAGLVSKAKKSRKNTMSIVMSVTYGEFEALFVGDATTETESYILEKNHISSKELSHDLITIGHHGSGVTSSSNRWLSSLTASIAVISSGHNNRYWHPHNTITSKLEVLLPTTQHAFNYIAGLKDTNSQYVWHSASTNKAILQTQTAGNIRFITDGKDLQIKTELLGNIEFSEEFINAN
ncbi:MBL fold metallo-hydrolase [Thalassotalea euphylliae]|nr:MBL fold metallo-hydrolase [Thalassotalea euphylliae]